MGIFARPPTVEPICLPYRPRTLQLLIGIPLFAATAAFFAHWSTNGHGLIVEGIELGPTGASRFKLACAAACAALAGFAMLFLLPQSLRRGRHIRLDADAIDVPVWHGWTDAAVRLRAADLTSVTTMTHRRATFLRLHHAGGVERINSSHLDRHEEVEAIVRWIAERRPDLMAA